MIAVFGQRCCCSFVNTYLQHLPLPGTYNLGNRRAPPPLSGRRLNSQQRATRSNHARVSFLGKTSVLLDHIARRIEAVQKIALLVTH
jgi:hypothetical protein